MTHANDCPLSVRRPAADGPGRRAHFLPPSSAFAKGLSSSAPVRPSASVPSSPNAASETRSEGRTKTKATPPAHLFVCDMHAIINGMVLVQSTIAHWMSNLTLHTRNRLLICSAMRYTLVLRPNWRQPGHATRMRDKFNLRVAFVIRVAGGRADADVVAVPSAVCGDNPLAVGKFLLSERCTFGDTPNT